VTEVVVVCPICKTTRTAAVFGQREIRITNQGETKKVGTELSAFRCEPGGHVFFVVAQDLKAADRGSEPDLREWGT
jgi:hypothetical protein